MSVNDRSAATRQFVASSSAFSSKWTAKRSVIFVYGLLAVFIAWLFVANAKGWSGGLVIAFPVLLLVIVGGGVGAYFWSRRKILIGATSEGLTVNQRRGDVFSFVDAKLGPWVTMGVALHLQCGRHRFLLGGRDRRIAPATRLDAPPVQAVDAWLWAADFDELLSLGGRRSGLDVRGPAPAEPTRCLLFGDPLLIQQTGPFAFRKKLRLQRSASQTQLAIDMDNDAIRVIDPNSNALGASASLAQVTATPVTYRPVYRRLALSPQSVASEAAYRYLSTTPGLVVCVPGLQPLTIGCRDFARMQLRFSWRGNVSVQNARAAYVVSGADWLALVDKFGLAPYLERRDQQA